MIRFGVIATAFLTALVLAASATAQGQPAPTVQSEAKEGATVPLDELLKPGPIRENVMGAADAPVTIVEYASMTCPHCATFHLKTLPAVKKEFIDTGKVKLVFRDFPFDGVAMAATMLSRCAASEKFFSITDMLFQRQEKWAFGQNPEAELTAIGKELGFDAKGFDACLQDQTVFEGILAVRKKAFEVFKVDSTPTLFINGEHYRGVLSPVEIAIHINRHLDKK